MGKDSYMDGFKYDVPAEKLGYIQKLGAGRIAPGKKGDLTAAKMMHGDAAAKYYDGAGMYMNGAPKYEGASKGMHAPGRHLDPNDPTKGHEVGSDRPSYTQQNTSQVVVPGTSSSTDTSSSGGGSESKTKLEKAKSGTKTKQSDSDYMTSLSKNEKFSGRTGTEMAEAGHISQSNIGAYDKIAGTSSSGGSTSSNSTTKPSVKTEVKKQKKTSKNQGAQELLDAGREREENRRNRYEAGQAERVNLARRDSANVADQYLKDRPINEQTLLHAIKHGNKKGRRTLVSRDSNKDSSFKEKAGEFRFTHDEANEMFSDNVGTGTANVTSGRGSKAKTGDQINIGYGYSSFGGQYKPSNVGNEIKIGKNRKGTAIVTGVNTDPGTVGSYGGFNTPQEYLSGGSPKMPHGPMKFGMNSSKHSK